MKILYTLAFAFIAAMSAPVASQAQDIEKPEVYVVKFYADWCKSCKIMKPAFDEFLDGIADKPVLHVHLDLTNEQTRQKAAYMMSGLGLGKVFEAHAPKTGYALLVDGTTQEVFAKLTKEMDTKAMQAELAKALNQAF